MGDFYLVNQYIPNSKEKLARLDYRLEYEDEVRKYLSSLDKKKPVVMCGDLNVAHNEIDLKNPSSNRRNAGFTDEERNKFTKLLEAGFINIYRYFYPEEKDKYTMKTGFIGIVGRANVEKSTLSRLSLHHSLFKVLKPCTLREVS